MKKTVPVRGGAARRGLRSKGHRKKSTRLEPKRPKHGRDDKGEETEDESAIFFRRAEWWRQYHGDTSGVVSGELRLQAIAHAEKLAANGLDNPDPGGARPKKGFELISGRGRTKAKAVRGKNPRPRSSFGFCSDAIAVRGPGQRSCATRSKQHALRQHHGPRRVPTCVKFLPPRSDEIAWNHGGSASELLPRDTRVSVEALWETAKAETT